MAKTQRLSREQLSRVLYAQNLTYFVAVAEAGSIREASRRLSISASAVSRQLVQLEQTIGIPLFDRPAGKLRVSAAGAALLRHCNATLRDLEATVADIDALQGLRTGTVRLATVESFSINLLPQLITAFTAKFPLIHIHVSVLPSNDVVASIADGQADIGFTFNPARSDRFTIQLRKKFTVGAVVAKKHPLTKSKRTSIVECLKFPVVLPSAGLSIRTTLDSVIAEHANALRSFVETTSLRVMTELALGGPFVTFQTRLGIEALLARRSLVFIDLTEQALGAQEFAIITDRRNAPRLAAAAFLDHTLASLPRLFPT